MLFFLLLFSKLISSFLLLLLLSFLIAILTVAKSLRLEKVDIGGGGCDIRFVSSSMVDRDGR